VVPRHLGGTKCLVTFFLFRSAVALIHEAPSYLTRSRWALEQRIILAVYIEKHADPGGLYIFVPVTDYFTDRPLAPARLPEEVEASAAAFCFFSSVIIDLGGSELLGPIGQHPSVFFEADRFSLS
jgi:hypothetical protein